MRIYISLYLNDDFFYKICIPIFKKSDQIYGASGKILMAGQRNVTSSTRNPQGKWIRFEYDALGRRTAKIVNTKIYRYLWDGNAILHEWFYENERRPKVVSDELGMLMLGQPEPVKNLTTWVYE